MKYNDLYKYRSVWMGIAILWIFYYHMGISVKILPLEMIHNIGYAGCDIFLFASGLGIYYSLNNSSDLYSYLKKRFLRLMPMYWIVLAFWIPFKTYIGEMTGQGVIGNIFGIQYFVDWNYDFNWYIPISLLCYVIAPFLKGQLDTFKPVTKLFVLVILVIVSFSFSSVPMMMMGMTRIPVFFLGMWFGQMGCKEKKISVFSRVIWILLSPIGIVTICFSEKYLGWNGWIFGLNWLPFLISVPGICIGISLLCQLIDKVKVGKFIVGIFSFLGKHSLEIYLSHATLVMVFRDWMIKNNESLNTNKNWLIVVVLSIIGAIVLFGIDKLVRLPFKFFKEKLSEA